MKHKRALCCQDRLSAHLVYMSSFMPSSFFDKNVEKPTVYTFFPIKTKDNSMHAKVDFWHIWCPAGHGKFLHAIKQDLKKCLFPCKQVRISLQFDQISLQYSIFPVSISLFFQSKFPIKELAILSTFSCHATKFPVQTCGKSAKNKFLPIKNFFFEKTLIILSLAFQIMTSIVTKTKGNFPQERGIPRHRVPWTRAPNLNRRTLTSCWQEVHRDLATLWHGNAVSHSAQMPSCLVHHRMIAIMWLPMFEKWTKIIRCGLNMICHRCLWVANQCCQ